MTAITTLPQALAAFHPMKRCRPFRFLDLPGELRNQIYGYASEGMILAQNLLDPAHPCLCRYLMIDGKLLDYDTIPRPLLQICRKIRTEFTPYLDGASGTMRAAVVVNFDFQPLLKHMERYPAICSPCQLEVQLRSTANFAPDELTWEGLLQWLQISSAEPVMPVGLEIDDPCKDDMLVMIHGGLYDIKFLGDPDVSEDDQKRLLALIRTFYRTVDKYDETILRLDDGLFPTAPGEILDRIIAGLGLNDLDDPEDYD